MRCHSCNISAQCNNSSFGILSGLDIHIPRMLELNSHEVNFHNEQRSVKMQKLINHRISVGNSSFVFVVSSF